MPGAWGRRASSEISFSVCLPLVHLSGYAQATPATSSAWVRSIACAPGGASPGGLTGLAVRPHLVRGPSYPPGRFSRVAPRARDVLGACAYSQAKAWRVRRLPSCSITAPWPTTTRSNSHPSNQSRLRRAAARSRLVDLPRPGLGGSVAQLGQGRELRPLLRQARSAIQTGLRVGGPVITAEQVVHAVGRDHMPGRAERVEGGLQLGLEADRRVHEQAAIVEAHHRHARGHRDQAQGP
jgi:hypothetical protein